MSDVKPTAFELDDATRFILGRPNYVLAPIAHRLRKRGHSIECRFEEEQAYVMHWLLHLYFQHGANWKAEADKVLFGDEQKAQSPIEDTGCEEDCAQCSGEHCETHGAEPCECDTAARHSRAARVSQ